jgi:hypothetical protein
MKTFTFPLTPKELQVNKESGPVDRFWQEGFCWS